MRNWMMMAAFAGLLVLGSAALFTGPRASAQEAEKKQPTAGKSAKELSNANNQFGFDALQQIHKEGKNTFISPTSIGMCLQMVSRGAKGDTLKEMNDTMHVDKLNVGQANRELLDALSNRDDLKLNLANSVWVNPNVLTLNRDYADKVQKEFDAQIEARNFAESTTLEEINRWVSDRTNEKIPELLKELSPEAAAVLVNAIYFKGEWSMKFDKEKTKEVDFSAADGTKSKVQMMERKDEYRYAQLDDAQLIALDYGADRNMCMWVMLPGQDKSLDTLVSNLDDKSFKAATQRAWEREGTIRLPRFKMKFRRELRDDLTAMGMKLAFTGDADFSGFEGDEPGKLFISKVIHESFIEVNEEGTEAAAATAAVMERGMPPKPFSMTCDRPFLIAIQDNVSGSILFLGTVYAPGKAE